MMREHVFGIGPVNARIEKTMRRTLSREDEKVENEQAKKLEFRDQ